MSYSKHERGKFIKSRMMDLILRKAPFEPGGGEELFSETWDAISEVSTAGNPTTKRCAENPIYKEALKAWQGAEEERAAR